MTFWKNELMVIRVLVRFGLGIPVEAVKACVLVGLHMIGRGEFWVV